MINQERKKVLSQLKKVIKESYSKGICVIVFSQVHIIPKEITDLECLVFRFESLANLLDAAFYDQGAEINFGFRESFEKQFGLNKEYELLLFIDGIHYLPGYNSDEARLQLTPSSIVAATC